MKNKKLLISIIFSTVFILIMVFSVIIPTFSRFQSGLDNPEWNGLASDGFQSGTGTEEDPYIISTPNELAYFALSMENNDYEGKYIKLIKDLVINKGIFKDETYIYNDKEYYLGNSKYYLDESLITEIGNINVLPIIKGFKGNFDGNFHTIYGLYEKDNEKNALFTDFSGKLNNLYIDNAYITGGNITSGVISDSNNASINNVLFNGKVFGNKENQTKTNTINIDDINTSTTYNKVLVNTPNIANGTLKGTCINTDKFILNNKEYDCTDFEIEVPNNIEIKVSNETIFSNITYIYSYEENKTSGIVALANNTEINGAVNKGNISGLYASGIVGTGINTNIVNSYNNGKIVGERSTGIIDTIMYSNNTIRNSYNTGDTKTGLISKIYYSTISVDKTFNTNEKEMIKENISSSLNISNSYNYLNKDLINNSYPKYIDEDNISNGNIWVGEEIPILYFDDLKNRTVQVKVGNNTWDNFKTDYKNIKYDKEIEVLISTTDMYKPIKNVWYYASNEIINKEDLEKLEWNEYNGIFKLNNNVYVLYVKYEDYNDNIYYISTDKLIVGSITSNVSINSGNTKWYTSHTPKDSFLNKDASYELSTNGNSLSISKIEYYISTTSLTVEDLENLEWNTYTNIFTPTEQEYIIYVKATDINSKITYINTDRMINMAYTISNLKSGNSLEYSKDITYNSSFNFNVELDHIVSISNYKRYIKVNKMLPKNTKITIKDKNDNYYEYITIDKDNLEIPLSNFKEAGKITFAKSFDDSYYNKLDTESFNINIDFSNTTKSINEYTLSFIAKDEEIINSKEDIVFNLVDKNNDLSINTNFNESINYGTDNTYNINLNTSLSNDILNTNYENLYEGISIEIIDKDNNIVPRDSLKYLRFKYNNTVYVLDKNNRLNINLGKTHNQNINLQVLTYNTNTNTNDTYKILIKGYLSIDGINKKYESINNISIPVILKKNNLDYNFDVKLNNPIINKSGKFNFNISYEGKLENPKLKVSLYKKKELTAYNQEYELVDLKDYVSNKLESSKDYRYETSLNNIVFTTKNSIESNGYRFVFELYDNENKVSEVDINTIIR